MPAAIAFYCAALIIIKPDTSAYPLYLAYLVYIQRHLLDFTFRHIHYLLYMYNYTPASSNFSYLLS